MRLPWRLPAPALAVALGVATFGLVIAPAARAATTATLSPLAGFHQMVVDSADGYIFISQGPAKGLAVFKTDGAYITTLDSSDVIEGITLSGSTLYAADVTQDAVAVIDAATATQTTTWSLGSGSAPYSVAVQSGKLWVSYGSITHGAIGDFDLSTGTFQAAGTVSTYSWYYAPELAADPDNSGVLVASDEGSLPTTVGTYSTSSNPAASLAGPQLMLTTTQDLCDNGQQAAVIPGGTRFVLTCGAPYEGLVLATNSLPAPVTTLAAEPYPGAAAVASDGSVAIGTSNGVTQNVYVYGPDLAQRNVLSVPNLVQKGIAWGSDSSTLYAVSNSNGSYTLSIFNSPELAQTALTLSSPATSIVGSAVSLGGKLTYASGAGAGTDTVSITRLNPDGSSTTLPSTLTDSTGAFTVSDTPPTLGAYTYTASYAGTATIAGSRATATVTVILNPATITLYAGSNLSLPPGTDLAFNGTLSFGTGAPAVGTALAVTRTNPDGSTTAVTTAQTVSGGGFSFTDAPTALGTYTYTASYAGDASTASAQGTTKVTVALATATIRLTAPKSVIPLKSYNITGSLGFSVASPAVGTALTVTRKNPNGTTSQITGVKTTDAGGDFGFAQPAESVLGAYAYTVRYAGSATTTPATGTATVTIAKGVAPLTVSTGHSTVAYNSTITVTAHLGSTLSNRTVTISASFPGSTTVKVLKTGRVNSAGNLAVSFPGAVRNVNFSATFSGDTQYNKTKVTAKVGVQVRMSITNSGWYKTATISGTLYHVYHIGNHVNYAITVTPNKSGQCVEFEVAYRSGNTWGPNVTSNCLSLNSSSQLRAYLATTGAPAGLYRARAVFLPSSKDVTNVTTNSGWFYIQLTN